MRLPQIQALAGQVNEADYKLSQLQGQIAANQDIVAAETKLLDLLRLQERLGELNDGAVASGLMAQLTSRGSARAQSIGIVRGYVAAQSGADRRRIERAWRRLLRQECFW